MQWIHNHEDYVWWIVIGVLILALLMTSTINHQILNTSVAPIHSNLGMPQNAVKELRKLLNP